MTKTEFFRIMREQPIHADATIEVFNGKEVRLNNPCNPNASLTAHRSSEAAFQASQKFAAWLEEFRAIEADHAEALEMNETTKTEDTNMADVKSCTINDKTYWRCIYEDGTRYYCVETKRRNQYGLTVKRQITAEGTVDRIDAELAGGMETVKEFLRAWLAWAEDGAVVHGFMDPTVGLCTNLSQWCIAHNIRGTARLGMMALFKTVLPGRDKMYPFGKMAYGLDLKNRTQHTNEKRLAWVREMLK